MKFNLKNKKAVVTGGGSGIGKAISKTFAAMGAIVHILEMNIDGGNQTVKEIIATGQHAVCHSCAVTNYNQIESIFEKINRSGDGIDILINT